MTEDPVRHTIDLSQKDLISLYLLLSGHESELDSTQQAILGRVCDQLYEMLSVEQIEDIDSFYKSV